MLRFRSILATLALLSCTTLAQADQVRGVIIKVDTEAGQFVIEGRGVGVRGTVFTFTLGKDAPVSFIGNKPAALKDVPVGKNVQVTYESQDGKKVAVAVRVSALKPADKGAKTDPDALSGKLRRVALTEREIVLAIPAAGDKETYISLPVADDAKITRDDKPIKLDDLKEEETAVVKTAMRDNRRVAVAVQAGKVTLADPDEVSNITRLRQIIKIADILLELAEKNAKK